MVVILGLYQWNFFFLCSNHSWVSFQRFAESYNDAHGLPHDLGKEINMSLFAGNYHAWFPWLSITELSARTVAEAFYNGELENELWRIKLVEYRMKDSDRESCMEEIERIRRENIYPHPDSQCTAECKARGTWMSILTWLCHVFIVLCIHNVYRLVDFHLKNLLCGIGSRYKAWLLLNLEQNVIISVD